MTVGDVGVCEGGFHVLMPHEFLDKGNIGAALQQMGGIAVPQGMDPDTFNNPRPVHGRLKDLLHSSDGILLLIFTFEEVFFGPVFAVIGPQIAEDGFW